MAEAEEITFVPIQTTGTYSQAVITAEASATETITLNDIEDAYVKEVISIQAHVAETGVPITYAYDNDDDGEQVLTRTTAGSDVDDVIVITYK